MLDPRRAGLGRNVRRITGSYRTKFWLETFKEGLSVDNRILLKWLL
jgi:hypothetical protein